MKNSNHDYPVLVNCGHLSIHFPDLSLSNLGALSGASQRTPAAHGGRARGPTPQSSVLRAQDEERRKISRELHDGLGQSMAAAKMIADSFLTHAPEKHTTTELVTILDDALTGVRTMLYLLHPPLLDEIGLASAQKGSLKGFRKGRHRRNLRNYGRYAPFAACCGVDAIPCPAGELDQHSAARAEPERRSPIGL